MVIFTFLFTEKREKSGIVLLLYDSKNEFIIPNMQIKQLKMRQKIRDDV